MIRRTALILTLGTAVTGGVVTTVNAAKAAATPKIAHVQSRAAQTDSGVGSTQADNPGGPNNQSGPNDQVGGPDTPEAQSTSETTDAG